MPNYFTFWYDCGRCGQVAQHNAIFPHLWIFTCIRLELQFCSCVHFVEKLTDRLVVNRVVEKHPVGMEKMTVQSNTPDLSPPFPSTWMDVFGWFECPWAVYSRSKHRRSRIRVHDYRHASATQCSRPASIYLANNSVGVCSKHICDTSRNRQYIRELKHRITQILPHNLRLRFSRWNIQCEMNACNNLAEWISADNENLIQLDFRFHILAWWGLTSLSLQNQFGHVLYLRIDYRILFTTPNAFTLSSRLIIIIIIKIFSASAFCRSFCYRQS